MKINKSTVYNWIKSLNKEMEKSKSEVEIESSKEEIEIDELYSYTKNKKTEHIR